MALNIKSDRLMSFALHYGDRIFALFCSCDLDRDPMTFIYELNRYSLAIYLISENELPTSFRNLSSDRHTYMHTYIETDRWQTDAVEIIDHAASGMVKNRRQVRY